jgi:hypothetical protein
MVSNSPVRCPTLTMSARAPWLSTSTICAAKASALA